jgi:hypothetical protein
MRSDEVEAGSGVTRRREHGHEDDRGARRGRVEPPILRPRDGPPAGSASCRSGHKWRGWRTGPRELAAPRELERPQVGGLPDRSPGTGRSAGAGSATSGGAAGQVRGNWPRALGGGRSARASGSRRASERRLRTARRSSCPSAPTSAVAGTVRPTQATFRHRIARPPAGALRPGPQGGSTRQADWTASDRPGVRPRRPLTPLETPSTEAATATATEAATATATSTSTSTSTATATATATATPTATGTQVSPSPTLPSPCPGLAQESLDSKRVERDEIPVVDPKGLSIQIHSDRWLCRAAS